MLERYNTTIYENRFIVGGVVEVFTLALLRSGGVPANGYGDETARGDLILPNNKRLSVKGRFTKGKSSIRLINTMGDSIPDWTTPTLFVLSNIGIVYGDPDMVDSKYLKKTKDALTLHDEALVKIRENANNVIQVNIPYKPPKEMTRFSHKASMPVARTIMFEQKLKTLLAQMRSDYGQHFI